MNATTATAYDIDQGLNEENQFRAGSYSLLAALLRTAPDAAMLCALGEISVDEQQATEMALAWNALKLAALNHRIDDVDDEFHNLFIGLGKGELTPYGSWYMTGFLMEKPLGLLRRDLALLGFERDRNVHEPEDHAAALMEVMTMMIGGGEAPVNRQRDFFNAHMAPWIERFFNDLKAADSAHFYCSVGSLGKIFFGLEKKFLSMPI